MKLISGFIVTVSLLFILNACTLNNNGSTTTPTQQGAFLIAQVSPNAPHLSIIINNKTFDTGFAYSAFTPYVLANAGAYSFSAIATDSSNSGNYANTVSLSINAKKNYSLYYIDSFNKIKTAFVNDVFQAPLGDSVYVRFFNFCPNLTQPISFVDTAGSVTLSQSRTFNDLANPQFTAFTEKPSRNYTIKLVTASGTVLTTQTLALTSGKVYTIIAKGIYGSTDSTKALHLGLLEHYPQRNIGFTF